VTELAHIQPRDCDYEELVIVNDVLREKNKELEESNLSLCKVYDAAFRKRTIEDADVVKAQLAIQVPAAATAYSLFAFFSAEPFLDHPRLAILLCSASLLAWGISHAIRKFG
jgi:hypothetical protein